MTTPYDPKKLRENVRDVVLDYLAAGLNPERAHVFVQSQVPEHVELAYLFSTVVSIARLSHLPTYKDKVKQYPEHNTMALLYYPILMAADILAYKTNELPVGDDQLPHIEITREIARKMNSEYGTDFPEPVRIETKGHYVPSLTGEGKMSKSVEGSYINLTDDLETIREKVAKIPTDSGVRSVTGKPSYPEGRSGPMFGVLPFVELFQGKEKAEEYRRQYITTGIRYKELKEELAEAIYKELEPIQKRRVELEKNPEYVDKVLREGAQKARKVAGETLEEVKEKMGLA